MAMRTIGIIMNGVTGRMGTNQHLERSIVQIRKEGGVILKNGDRVMPEPLLVGRDAAKLDQLARRYGGLRWSTNLDEALGDPAMGVYFDAQLIGLRPAAVSKAIAAGKSVYCEKPLALSSKEALELYHAAREKGIKHGVVQDKLWLPGILKLKYLIDTGFFGRILSVRGEFGYWVFDGVAQPCQRPSWNYRKEDGGGIILDMYCHWQYVIENLFGEIKAVSALGATHIPERVDERGTTYRCTAEDAAYGTFELHNGIICQFNSSWCVRVRRDDLFVMQVDGTQGSAVAGLRDCVIQSEAMTPKPVWNPDIDSGIDHYALWARMPTRDGYDNAFKVQWERFLRHIADEEPFRWDFLAGAKGVQLAELAIESWQTRRWVDVPALV
ncbi:MAG: Gfo/Idh/MocA family oxidoreductase [Rectinema sp.]|nr:Gfo/Idh/MocA family oxidoreductase [Rectinema sp.]